MPVCVFLPSFARAYSAPMNFCCFLLVLGIAFLLAFKAQAALRPAFCGYDICSNSSGKPSGLTSILFVATSFVTQSPFLTFNSVFFSTCSVGWTFLVFGAWGSFGGGSIGTSTGSASSIFFSSYSGGSALTIILSLSSLSSPTNSLISAVFLPSNCTALSIGTRHLNVGILFSFLG